MVFCASYNIGVDFDESSRSFYVVRDTKLAFSGKKKNTGVSFFFYKFVVYGVPLYNTPGGVSGINGYPNAVAG